MKSLLIVIVIAASFISCGASNNTGQYDVTVPIQANPFINRIAPVAATAGDTVTIFGYGFSTVPQFNIVIIGGAEIFANTYNLLAVQAPGEVESLTFVVPAGLTLGVQPIYVDVLDNVSNTNVTITIN